MKPSTTLLSTFITLAVALPAPGINKKVFLVKNSSSLIDFSTASVGVRDRMRDLLMKSLDVLPKVNF